MKQESVSKKVESKLVVQRIIIVGKGASILSEFSAALLCLPKTLYNTRLPYFCLAG